MTVNEIYQSVINPPGEVELNKEKAEVDMASARKETLWLNWRNQEVTDEYVQILKQEMGKRLESAMSLSIGGDENLIRGLLAEASVFKREISRITQTP